MKKSFGETNLFLTARGEGGIVGDEKERHFIFIDEFENEIGDLLVIGLVEVSGRLVGEEKGRFHADGTSDGDTLAFAPGKLGRIMIETVREADLFERGEGAVLDGRGAAAVVESREFEGQEDIFKSRQMGHEMKLLENNPERLGAEAGEFVLCQAGEVATAKDDGAAAWKVETGDEGEEGRFAAPGLAEDGEGVAFGDVEIEAAEDLNGFAGNGRKLLDDAVEFKDGHDLIKVSGQAN